MNKKKNILETLEIGLTMIWPKLSWPNLVLAMTICLAKHGLAKLGFGHRLFGQILFWPKMVWPNFVLAKDGLAKLGFGQSLAKVGHSLSDPRKQSGNPEDEDRTPRRTHIFSVLLVFRA